MHYSSAKISFRKVFVLFNHKTEISLELPDRKSIQCE